MKKIAVILTCHNRKGKTLASLEALYNVILPQGYSLEIFLVDDGSIDGTGASVKAQFPGVNVILGNGELYWNRGMHLAWQTAAKSADFDYYLWLNDDTVLKVDAIKELLEGQQYIHQKGIVCGAVCSAVTSEFSYGGKLKSGKAVLPNGTFQSCEIIEGNSILVSKKVFEKVGMLDPVFPHAIGDHDYGLRVLKNGFKVITTRSYVGYCENNPRLPKWCYGTTPLKERFTALYSPLGYSSPKYYFIYENRHFGLFTAVKHYFSIHLRALIPSLWK